MNETEPLVVVIDDNGGVCRAMARVLGVSGFRARTYESARDFLDELDGIEPACVLADIRMPDVNGIELARALRAAGQSAPIVFMTATGDVATVVDAMKQGAIDLLPKPFSATAMLAAVKRAIELGHQSEETMRALASLWRTAGRLTQREAEVCALVACGAPNKNVAVTIGTTEKTVKVHRGRVMQKMASPSLAELVRMVDRLTAEPSRMSIRLDGMEHTRPPAVGIIVDVMSRVRSTDSARRAPVVE